MARNLLIRQAGSAPLPAAVVYSHKQNGVPVSGTP